jgi:DNA (cytosine-5)-methyltransferase 1
MSWLFSQALVEEYLGDTSLDGKQSVPLSGNNTQQAYCALDKMTDFCRVSQFGMMFKPLTENLGKELLMSYLEDFPVRTYQPLGGGAGITGSRSSMWKHMARIVCEVRPKFVFVENSPMLTSRGLGVVLGDLAEMGFDAEWGVLGAANVGAPHFRERIWICAKQREFLSHSKYNGIGWWEQFKESVEEKNGDVANSSLPRLKTRNKQTSRPKQYILEKQFGGSSNEQRRTKYDWPPEPNMGRVVNGLAARVDRLKAIGNGQVPQVAAVAWDLLTERLNERNRPQ